MASIGVALGCGPDFPNIYYWMTEGELLRGPQGVFAAEIARIAAPRAVGPHAVRVGEGKSHLHTVEIDIADVKRSLAERGSTRDHIEWAYVTMRQNLEAWLERRHRAEQAGIEEREEPPRLTLPQEVPVEFHLYLRGALAWHQRKLPEARTAWGHLLALPAGERRYRTTWATFMLGRLEAEAVRLAAPGDAEALAVAYGAARQRMAEVRALVADGWRDPLGLAAASLGWEARAALSARDYPTAMNLYLEQHAAGDESALASLRFTAAEILDGEGVDLVMLARTAETRRVITACLLARGTPDYGQMEGARIAALKAWATALETAGVNAVAEADRLAWIAYDAGLFPLAERWAALAPAEAEEACWIRAKLALRRGNLEQGETLLRATLAGKALGVVHREQVLGELSRVCLARNDFKAALEAALAGELWDDAAFVAERVMSLAELMRFVDGQSFPAALTDVPADPWNEPLPLRLRHLLARRLARAGRTDEAEKYFPPAWRARFLSYAENVRIGFDVTRPDGVRAKAFWQAARLAREDGLELLGTELDPDYAISGASGPGWRTTLEHRTWLAREGDSFAPTPVELQRLETHVTPAKRFHYRYRAAELAWWAASLLPNDADETAEILNTAGSWLKARDPAAAQPFYRALVIRCGKTALGQAAAKAKWFPKPEPVESAKL